MSNGKVYVCTACGQRLMTGTLLYYPSEEAFPNGKFGYDGRKVEISLCSKCAAIFINKELRAQGMNWMCYPESFRRRFLDVCSLIFAPREEFDRAKDEMEEFVREAYRKLKK